MERSKELLEELRKDIPEFVDYEEFDELLYVDYGRLGTFLMSLLRQTGSCEENHRTIKKIFQHLNRIYRIYGKEVANLIVVSIFEAIRESEKYVEIVEGGFSEELKKLFYEELKSGNL